MAITALDTHQTVKDLTAAGFTDAQAEALKKRIGRSPPPGVTPCGA